MCPFMYSHIWLKIRIRTCAVSFAFSRSVNSSADFLLYSFSPAGTWDKQIVYKQLFHSAVDFHAASHVPSAFCCTLARQACQSQPVARSDQVAVPAAALLSAAAPGVAVPGHPPSLGLDALLAPHRMHSNVDPVRQLLLQYLLEMPDLVSNFMCAFSSVMGPPRSKSSIQCACLSCPSIDTLQVQSVPFSLSFVCSPCPPSLHTCRGHQTCRASSTSSSK